MSQKPNKEREREVRALGYKYLAELELYYLHKDKSNEEWGREKKKKKSTLIHYFRKQQKCLPTFMTLGENFPL